MIKKVVFIGATVALLALYWIPQVHPACLAWWPVYTGETANAATTISGILAPLLSLATLTVVYFTLREQGRTNVLQRQQLIRQRNDFKRQQREFQETVTRQANESFFDLTYKIVERFSETVEKQKRLFAEVPEINLGIRRGERVTSSERMGATRPARQDELFGYQRQFFTLTQFFSVISRRIEGELLTGEQKMVLLDLLDVTYGDVLGNAISDYQRRFGSEQIEQEPDDMYTEFREQRKQLYLMRQQAEEQAKTESIPFGDADN